MGVFRRTLTWAVLAIWFVIALGWAGYVSWAYLWLARTVPVDPGDVPKGAEGVLASVQGFAVAFGP
jgi:hypothetical protein